MRPTLLLWNIHVVSEVVSNFANHPETKDFTIQHIAPEQMDQTLSALIGLEDCKQSTTKSSVHVALPCIVFCHLTEQQLDLCLSLLRQCSQKVALKAVLTPHNQNWQFSKLLAELDKEYQHFQSKSSTV